MSTFRNCTILAGLAGAAAVAAVSTSHTPAPPAPIAEMPIIEEGMSCITNQIASTIFAEGTDPEVIAKVYNMILKPIEAEMTQRYYTGSRWPGSFGSPVDLTYSFPADGITMDAGSGNPNVLHADLNIHFGNETVWKGLFRQAFDQWEEYTGNTYTEVSDNNSFWGASGPQHGGSGRGDIRIWSRSIDGGSNTLAFNFFPGSGVGGDMVLDSAENWSSGPSINYRFFRNVITHENGHGMGLAHVCTDAANRMLMNPFATTSFDGPQQDDIRGMQRLYGDYSEPNNTNGVATDLGFFDPMDTANLFGLSVFNSDDDFYAMTVGGSSLVNVTVTPVGDTYEMAPQAGNGSCPSGPDFNAMDQHNLRVRVLTGGGAELAMADDNPVGLPESLEDVSLPGGGTFYIVVDSTDTFNSQTQLYNLFVESSIPLPPGDLNGDCVVDTADLGGIIGAFGGSGPFGDINGDGVIDTADLGILIANFGVTCDDL